MPTEREEHSIRLTKPRTFRDSPFAFTDARAAVPFDRFGEVEVTQDVTEGIGFSGDILRRQSFIRASKNVCLSWMIHRRRGRILLRASA